MRICTNAIWWWSEEDHLWDIEFWVHLKHFCTLLFSRVLWDVCLGMRFSYPVAGTDHTRNTWPNLSDFYDDNGSNLNDFWTETNRSEDSKHIHTSRHVKLRVYPSTWARFVLWTADPSMCQKFGTWLWFHFLQLRLEWATPRIFVGR